MPKIIYILTNPTMQDVVKIGRTRNLESRMSSLYKTNIPVPFECYFACTVANMEDAEKSIHDIFLDYRINPKREFFRVDPERVVSALRMIMIEEVTPNIDIVEDEIDQKSLDRERLNRARFNFEMVKIEPNSELTFYRDPSLKAIVLNNKNIEFEGNTHTPSSAALIISHRMGFKWKSIQGPKYWVFEGETLIERRSRMENE